MVKISPDLSDDEIFEISEIGLKTGLDGFVACNTTAKRQSTLSDEQKNEIGGLSGPPLERNAKRVLVEMGASGSALDACAREIYDEWATCHHFVLYEDVRPTFSDLCKAGYRIGLISNTHRCLETFQDYFNLSAFVTAAVSSSDHGYLKPHPSIFHEALRLVGVSADQGVMVGDSVTHDVMGARQVGMKAILLARSGDVNNSRADEVPEIRSLVELPKLLARWPIEPSAGK